MLDEEVTVEENMNKNIGDVKSVRYCVFMLYRHQSPCKTKKPKTDMFVCKD